MGCFPKHKSNIKLQGKWTPDSKISWEKIETDKKRINQNANNKCWMFAWNWRSVASCLPWVRMLPLQGPIKRFVKSLSLNVKWAFKQILLFPWLGVPVLSVWLNKFETFRLSKGSFPELRASSFNSPTHWGETATSEDSTTLHSHLATYTLTSCIVLSQFLSGLAKCRD